MDTNPDKTIETNEEIEIMKETFSQDAPRDKHQEIRSMDDTKEIAGYKCKHALITNKKDNTPMDAWFTSEIRGSSDPSYSWKGIDGFIR